MTTIQANPNIPIPLVGQVPVTNGPVKIPPSSPTVTLTSPKSPEIPKPTSEFNELPEKIQQGIDTISSQQLGENSKKLPQPSMMTQTQSKTQETPQPVVQQQIEFTPHVPCQLRGQALLDSLKNKFIEFKDMSEGNVVEKCGLPILHEALKNVPNDVKEILQIKNVHQMLTHLLEHDWVLSNLTHAHFCVEEGFERSPKLSEFRPEVYGHNGGCNESSTLLGHFLLNLVIAHGCEENQQVLTSLKGGTMTAHNWVVFTDHDGKNYAMDPTWRQFQMTKKEGNRTTNTDFIFLSDESQKKILNSPMIFFGSKEDHKKICLFLDQRPN